MFKVYILYSKRFDKLYIGYNSSFRKRIESHNLYGKHDWTRNYRPWLLIHLEEYATKKEAMQREKSLKGGQGREFIHKEILPHFQ